MAEPRLAARALLCALAVPLVLASGCAGGADRATIATGTTLAGAAAAPSQRAAAPVVIRMAMAPDPIWSWLEDSGARAAWEAANNVRLEVSNPFDQFAAFAGGHADVVVVNALDVPQFAEQPERQPVIIGKYTTDRSVLAVRRTSRAESLEDLVERRIAVETSLASTLLWGLVADFYYDLDFGVNSADFELVTVDSAGLADLVMRGDVDACICTPDYSVPLLANGRLRALYGGRTAAELYAAGIFGGLPSTEALGTIADAFVVDAAWHAANPRAVAALLSLWQQGVEHWKQNRAQTVADYPHHFSVESDMEIAWLADYVAEHDWIVPSVYITGEESETQLSAFKRLKTLGLLPEDANPPAIDLSNTPEGSQPASGAGG